MKKTNPRTNLPFVITDHQNIKWEKHRTLCENFPSFCFYTFTPNDNKAWKIAVENLSSLMKKSAKIWKRNRKSCVGKMTWRRGVNWNLLNVCRECEPIQWKKINAILPSHSTHTHTETAICSAWFLFRFLFRVFIWRLCVSILEHNVLSVSVVIGLCSTPGRIKQKFLCYRFLHKIIGFQLNNKRNIQNMGLCFFLLGVTLY